MAIYCRISKDPTGLRSKVEAQEAACRELVERAGFELIGDPEAGAFSTAAFVDNDASAIWGKRPKWHELLRLAQQGVIDGIVAWHPDRLYRRTADLEGLITTLQDHQLRLHTVSSDLPIDLASPTGRMIARQLAAWGQYEVEHAAARRRAANQARFEQGIPHAGRRWFGYQQGNLLQHAEEAELFKAVVRRFLADDKHSLAAVTRWMNEQPGMADWKATRPPNYRLAQQTLREWLRHARYAGVLLRTDMETRKATGVYRGHPADAQVRKGGWEPLISMDEHEKLKAILDDPQRLSPGRSGTSLLSGLIRCSGDGCNAFLHAATDAYRCNAKSGCGNRTVGRAAVESLIIDSVLAVIADPDLLLRRTEEPQLTDLRRTLTIEIAELERRMRDTPAELISRGVPTEGVLAAVDALNVQLTDRKTALRALPDPSVDIDVPPGLTEAAFRAATTEQQAPVIRHLIQEIVLLPFRNTGNRFDEDRVLIWWRGGEKPTPPPRLPEVVGLQRARKERRPRVTREGEVQRQVYARPRKAGAGK